MTPGPTLQAARVLVVEDDPGAAATLSVVLEASGFWCAVVADAASALEVTLAEDVAVVLCGFSRSGIGSTTDLVTRFRARPEPQLRGARIVALTERSEDALFGLDEAADGVLLRPVHAQQLADTVTEVAARRPPHAPRGRSSSRRQPLASSRSIATSTAS